MLIIKFGDGGDFVLAGVGAVDFLSFGTDADAFGFPIDLHFDENSIDSLHSHEINHSQLLKLIFEQDVILISAEVQVLDLVFKADFVFQFETFMECVNVNQAGLVQSETGH